MAVSIVFEDEAGEEQVVIFDATLTVKPELGADITQLPVETKQNITDHIRPQLDRLSVEAFVTNTPVPVLQEYTTTKLEIAPRVSDITEVEDPDSFGLGDIPGPGTLNRAVQGAIGDVLSGLFPPELKHLDLSNLDVTDRVRDVYDSLDQIRRKGTECRIVTKFKDFEGMHISLITPLRGVPEGNGARFTIDFQEVRVSETSTKAFPVPEETRALPAVSLGSRSGKKPKDEQTEGQNETLLHQLGVGGGLF